MRSLFAVMMVAAFVPAVMAEEVDSPTYKAWAAYKVGTTVVTKTVSETAGNKSEIIMTYKLLELTPDKALVELTVKTKVAGMEFDAPATKTDHPKKFKVEGQKAPAPDKKPDADLKRGEETVKIAGKEFKCQWVEAKVGEGTSKTWTCDTVPGMIVKMESSAGGSTTKMELVEIKTP